MGKGGGRTRAGQPGALLSHQEFLLCGEGYGKAILFAFLVSVLTGRKNPA
jgi:hypothetical protein